MSLRRLTADERATFLIGVAFRRFFADAKVDQRAHKLVWAAYVRAVDASLTPDEHHHVMIETGFTDESWMVVPDAYDAEIDAEVGLSETEEVEDPDGDDVPF